MSSYDIMVSIEIVSPPTPKPAFVLEVSYFWVLGVSSGCWKRDGVGSESKLGVGSEGLTFLDIGPFQCVHRKK